MKLLSVLERVLAKSKLKPFVGSPHAIHQRAHLQRACTPLRGLEHAMQRVDLVPTDDAPVFIIAPTWRCGSTLLQRLINSTDKYFVWGEPYFRAHVVERLVDAIAVMADGYPEPAWVWGGRATDLSGWTANMYPSVEQWFIAQRIWLQSALAPPDRMAGRQWGMKSVLYGGPEISYLRWLFPRSRVVVLVRDPADAYVSYKSCGSWFERFPDTQIRTVGQFAKMWFRHAHSLLDVVGSPNALLVRYEDVARGRLDELEVFLGADLNRAILGKRMSGVDVGRLKITALERKVIRYYCARTMIQLGYARAA